MKLIASFFCVACLPAEITKQNAPTSTVISSKHICVVQISTCSCIFSRWIITPLFVPAVLYVEELTFKEVESKALWLWGFTSLCFSSWVNLAKACAVLGSMFIMRIFPLKTMYISFSLIRKCISLLSCSALTNFTTSAHTITLRTYIDCAHFFPMFFHSRIITCDIQGALDKFIYYFLKLIQLTTICLIISFLQFTP